jgi:pSer/pThr/pTyr-binding forkhead associated (FHA) protein
VRAAEADGEVSRCSVCGRDTKGYPGATGPVLRCVDPPQHRHLVLPIPFEGRSRVATVGRSDLMHWPQRSSATNSISRSHLRIRRDGARYLIEDLSTNGTALRGEELMRGRPAEIHDGDLIGLVTTGAKPVLVLEFCVPSQRAPEPGALAEAPPPPVQPEAVEDFEVVREAAPGGAADRRPAPARADEAEPVLLPDGEVPRFAHASPAPSPPTRPRPAQAPSRQRESEAAAGETQGPAPSGDSFEAGLADLLKKAKPQSGKRRGP